MKLFEIRLYKLKVIKNDEIIFEGISEELPQELKDVEILKIDLIEGEAVIKI